MSVTIRDHQHDPAVVFDGGGTPTPIIMIQTGTIIFDFEGLPYKADWVRDRLSLTVLELPPATTFFKPNIMATASAAPASMSYGPPTVVRAQESNIGYVPGELLPEIETPVYSVLAGGWAVDRTQARQSGNKIQLDIDLAVLGHSRLMRLAYSVFVTVIPATGVTPDHP